MNWLKLKLRDWVNSAQDIEMSSNRKMPKGLAISSTSDETLSTEPLRLNIYRANGGTVIETRQYDRQKDRNQNQLHIISHDDDLGQSIAKIIMLESLRG
jgi:hypothetical protein